MKENIKPVAVARIETVAMPGAVNRLSGSKVAVKYHSRSFMQMVLFLFRSGASWEKYIGFCLFSTLIRVLKLFLSLSQSIRAFGYVFYNLHRERKHKSAAATRIETVTMPGAGNRLSGSNIRDESTHRQR